MRTSYKATLMASVLFLSASAVALADEVVSESRPVDARVVKVQLDGVVSLKIKQGTTPSLVVYADKDTLQKITTVQNGEVLRINGEVRGFHFGNNHHEMRAELTLPNLTEVTSSGFGSSDVSGFWGDSVKVMLEGAGQVQFAGNYKKVNASLSGLGNLSIDSPACDSMTLSLPGAGRVSATGKSKSLKADLSGLGSLNAKDLKVASADVNLSGLGNATVTASDEARVNLSGLGSATVYGQPVQRSSNNSGMGQVTWKK
jgi:hypothetical protein